MRTKRITTNLPVEDIEASKGFYTDFPGRIRRSSTSAGSRGSPIRSPGRTCSS